jgi:hypothetical protein
MGFAVASTPIVRLPVTAKPERRSRIAVPLLTSRGLATFGACLCVVNRKVREERKAIAKLEFEPATIVCLCVLCGLAVQMKRRSSLSLVFDEALRGATASSSVDRDERADYRLWRVIV